MEPISYESKRFVSKGVFSDYDDPFDRQKRLHGWDQEKVSKARITVIGAGISGKVLLGLVKEGVGHIKIIDHDLIELSNLHRQFFSNDDLYKNKAIALGQNLIKYAPGKTEIIAYPQKVQNTINKALDCDLAICMVDNDEARAFVAKHFWEEGIPVIYGAITDGATGCNVVVQKDICYGCARPDVANNYYPCKPVPSVVRAAMLCAGAILYASDMIIQEEKLPWNYYDHFLSGFSRAVKMKRREDCSICQPEKRS